MRTMSRLFGTLILVTAALSAQTAPPADIDPGGQGGPQDQPGQAVARISVLNGDASLRHGDTGDWIAVILNAPILAGDTLSTTPGATIELQMDAANFIRIAGDSEVRIAGLDNGHFQFQLSRGLVTYRALRQNGATPEVDTPLVAVRPDGLASLRIEVAPDGSTRITARHGAGQVYTPKGAERIAEANTMVLRGTMDDPEFQVVNAAAPDVWDQWNDQRDTYLMRTVSDQRVSPDITGAEDLDNYGRWNNDPQYGDVWTPNVPATWAPYRNGQWCWNDAYGWTWVDAAPWGWAPFHYGSWYFRTGFGWSWFPGLRYGHYWYHPALVSFFGFGGGGFGVGFGFGNVGWVPLAPFERFHPWYGGGRALAFNSVALGRGVNVAATFRNARFAGGVTSVSAGDFQRGNFRNATGVDRAQLQSASLVRGGAPMTPTASNRAFTSRAPSAAGPRTSVANQRFFTSGSARATQSGGAPGWQRFGSGNGQPAGGGQRFGSTPQVRYGGGGARSLQVTPPIVRQRQSAPAAAPSHNAPSYNRGGYSAPAPRSAPAPQSAPRPSGGGGGGSHPSSGGGRGGGRR
jgi:hypothetical protein